MKSLLARARTDRGCADSEVEATRTSISLSSSRSTGRALALGLACALVAACTSSEDITGAGGAAGTGLSSAGAGRTGSGTAGNTSSGSAGSTSSGSAGSTSSGTAGTTSSGTAGTGSAGTTGTGGSNDAVGSGGSTSSGGTGGDGAVGGGQTAGSGSGGSGGSSAAGGVSGGAGSAAPAGCPAGATFCDDFEASATLGAVWTTDNTLGATVKVVSTYTTTPGPTMAHSGKNAVQISFTTGSGYAMIVSKMSFPAPPAPTGYWGRVWLYVETPTTDASHDVYIEGSTGMNLGNNGVRPLNTQKGDMTINIDPVGTGEAGANTTTPIPRGAWTCFEWQISATGGTGNVVLYAGGSAMPTVSLNGKPIGALIEQRVGYERYASGTAGNLWIDDYAIGTKRLNCM